MEDKLICPLMIVNRAQDRIASSDFYSCLKDKCEWYTIYTGDGERQGCSVRLISEALTYMAENFEKR